jgi:sulfhydrogenase subunit delta
MRSKPPLKFAYLRFTSCSGCQLMLTNCEDQLADLAEAYVWSEFSLAFSAREQSGQLDIALVEGSISTTEELTRLLDLRRRAELLVAVGACALTGGINVLVKPDRCAAIVAVYDREPFCMETFPPQPLHHFVTVDWQIPGCPPERHELVETLGSILQGGCPGWQDIPVCMECRVLENRCLLIEDHQPCLGPVTRAGCRAKCPSLGVLCEGCRGAVAEANWDELFRLLLESGLPESEVRSRLQRFQGVAHD